MDDIFKDYLADEIEEVKGKIKRIEIRKKEYKALKEKLEEHFNFEIVDYIIYDILDYETYHHTCLMINLAIINNRISIENGEILKAGLKILFKIKDRDDRFNRGVYINTFDFDSWYEKYSTKELIDLSKYLSKSDISLIKKLDIKIKNKIYTEQEFEVLNMDLLSYYIAEDMEEEEKKESKPLPKEVSRDEYNKFQRLERDYSTYSGSQVVTIFKTLLENYEGEEYNVLINDLNQLIALPSDKNSKSLKLEIGNLYNGDTFYKSMDLVLIFPYKIDKYINISSFQSDMQINYLEDFFTSLVEYRYSKDLSSIKDDKVVDILNKYIDTKKDDIISYQEQKKKCLAGYIELKKEEKIKDLFNVDKYALINEVKDFINENYDTNLEIFCDVNEGRQYSDNRYYYLDYYRTIGLKDNDNIVFKIKELSYTAKDDEDSYRPIFYYRESECIDRNINVYYLESLMKELSIKYPMLDDYFDGLDEKYREFLNENCGTLDSKKLKKVLFKSKSANNCC